MRRNSQDIIDELLVLRAQDGNADALEALFARWHARLSAYAARVLGSTHDANDACQDAWISITRNLRRLDDPARFRQWAFRIVTNRCRDLQRKRTRSRRNERTAPHRVENPDPDPSASAETTDEIQRLRAEIARLDPGKQAVLTMLYLEEMTVAQIAHALDIPPGTIKSRLFAARNQLRESLERTDQ